MWAQPASIGQIFNNSDEDSQMATSRYIQTALGEVRLRRMQPGDLWTAARIEQESYPFPWEYEDFIEELKTSRGLHLVAERSDGVILGYVIASPMYKQFAIHNLTVDQQYRRKGIGSLLLNQIRDRADRVAGRPLCIKACEKNLPAHLFLKRMGMTAIGTVRNYYGDKAEGDMYMFSNRPSGDFQVVDANDID